VVSTVGGSLFQVFLMNALGQPGLSYSQLSKPVGVFARFGSMIGFGAEDRDNTPLKTLIQGSRAGLTRFAFYSYSLPWPDWT